MNSVVLAAGPRLSVHFDRRGDRFGHTIVLLRSGEEAGVELASIEGTPEDLWPASPVLQSLNVEQRGGRRLALLLGMAGGSHWSASVEADPDGRRLTFDVACRFRSPPERLGSHYQLVIPAGSTFRADDLPLVVDDLPGEPPARLQTEGGDIAMLVAAPAFASSSLTVRWRYALESP